MIVVPVGAFFIATYIPGGRMQMLDVIAAPACLLLSIHSKRSATGIFALMLMLCVEALSGLLYAFVLRRVTDVARWVRTERNPGRPFRFALSLTLIRPR